MTSRLATIVALLLTSSSVAAQDRMVGGYALDLQTSQPLPCIGVELLAQAGLPIASTRTGLGGDFEFRASRQDEYRIRFSALGLASVTTGPESLTAAPEYERVFRVDFALLDTAARGRQVAQFDSSEVPQFVVGKGLPRYPDAQRMKGVSGEVIIGYAVTDDGKIDLQSAITLRSSHPAFLRAVEKSLPDQRFRPAQRGGRATCVFRAGTFVFRLDGLIGRIYIG